MKSSVYKIENLKDTFNNINSSAEAARRTELINIHSAPGSEIHEDLIAHHHGINALDNEGDFIISGSAKGHNPSYFYPIINRHGRHLGKFELSDEVPVSNTYTRVGGIQVAENILVTSTEETCGISAKTDRSLIRFFDISDPDDVKHVPHLDIVRKGESQNASASGIIKISDQWIVGVRAEKSLDFFVLNGDITSPENKFESIGSIGIAENDIGEFQSINLFTDADDELYFVGFCPDKINNSAELIKVETKRNDAGKIVVVVKADSLAKKEFDTIDDGVKFKYAAGMKFVPEANSPKDKAKGKFQVFSACGYVDNTKIVLNSWE